MVPSTCKCVNYLPSHTLKWIFSINLGADMWSTFIHIITNDGTAWSVDWTPSGVTGVLSIIVCDWVRQAVTTSCHSVYLHHMFIIMVNVVSCASMPQDRGFAGQWDDRQCENGNNQRIYRLHKDRLEPEDYPNEKIPWYKIKMWNITFSHRDWEI